MLILSRRIGEILIVGDEIKLKVLGTKGNQVRLGIKAPKEVGVHREEVYRQKKQENEKMAASASTEKGLLPTNKSKITVKKKCI